MEVRAGAVTLGQFSHHPDEAALRIDYVHYHRRLADQAQTHVTRLAPRPLATAWQISSLGLDTRHVERSSRAAGERSKKLLVAEKMPKLRLCSPTKKQRVRVEHGSAQTDVQRPLWQAYKDVEHRMAHWVTFMNVDI